MGKGKTLSDYEKGQIDARRALGHGYAKIAKALGRSAENKEYKTVAELKQAILAAWNGLNLQTFQNHVNSMPNRIFQVINRNGDATDYWFVVVSDRFY